MKAALVPGLLLSCALLCAQPNTCGAVANLPIVRAEGLSERTGDIQYNCTGAPNASLTANITIFFNAPITNRISAGNTLTGILFTSDNGGGSQPVLVTPELTSPTSLAYNGVSLTLSAQGTLSLRIAGIRVNASLIPPHTLIQASLAVNGGAVLTSGSQVFTGYPQPGLYAGFSGKLVCAQSGSLLPDSIDFMSLIAQGTAFTTTRVTEGFADAFGARPAWANFNADTGERILVTYSGFPPGARLFVPDVVAGSDALQPTAGGDFGLPASGGAYAPTASGSLLLARVQGADANGAGGAPVYTPLPVGAPAAGFNTVTELALAGGSASVVYEVVDANGAAPESAQFPTFLGLAPNGVGSPVPTNEDVFFAPQSTVGTASVFTIPIPRFAAIQPPPDCTIIGDCVAPYVPFLDVDTTPIQFTAAQGSGLETQYVLVRNDSGGVMFWNATLTYGGVGGWINLYTTSGTNGGKVRVDAVPGGLAPGTYQATLTINAGPATGSKTVSITLVITPPPPSVPPPAPVPRVDTVLNSASLLAAPVVPGSLATLTGSNLTGHIVSAAFDGYAATVVSSTATKIVLLVPPALGAQTSARLTVTVDGVSSAAQSVSVAPFAPAIFPGAVLNSDATVNGVNNGADPGSIIFLYATGLSGAGTITGHIADRDIDLPYYAGPAPDLPGVQQVNLQVPPDLQAMATEVYVCGAATATPNVKVCSASAPLTLQ